MPVQQWFVFDLGNTVIKIAYERVLRRICALAPDTDRDELVAIMERAGGYRDLERGQATFSEFYEFLRESAGYLGTIASLRDTWVDFFDGPVEGIEEVLARVRRNYRVAYASNSNEIHADFIPRQYAPLFRKDERFVFSHLHKCAKPDRVFFERTLNVLGALPSHVIFVDDLLENVRAALDVGLNAYQFRDSITLVEELERDGLLPMTET
jgi:HAD superfamily hydrolase (TIGR01509 family)